MLESIEFETTNSIFYPYRLHIDTKEQTHVWLDYNTNWIAIEEGESKLSYTKDSEGKIGDRKIYLSKEDLKKYSKEYSKVW